MIIGSLKGEHPLTRRPGSHETWHRLNMWTDEQAPAERLAAQILRVEGFVSIDPIHPLGGRDDRKDMVCRSNEKEYIGAVYFPRGQKSFNELKTKFSGDLEGVKKNNVDGIVFVTNQEIPQANRKALEKLAGNSLVEIYHLERITSILDSPRCYGIRQEYLGIDVSKEELSALLAENRNTIEQNKQLLEENRALMSDLRTLTERMITVTSESYFLKAEDAVNELRHLRAMRFLLDDRNEINLPHYRYLAVFLHGSLDNAVPIILQSSTFEDFIENSTGKKPIIKELPDIKIEQGYRLVSHGTAYPPAIEPGSEWQTVEGITKDNQVEMNQIALNVYRLVHGKLIEAVRPAS